MRKPHFINKNSKGERPTRLVFVDTETKSVQLTPTIQQAKLSFGYALYERLDTKKEDWLRFETNDSFWNWLDSKTATKTKTYVFAHNLGGFDLMVLEFSAQLKRLGWKAESIVIECPPTIIVYQKTRIENEKEYIERSIVFCDTLNWFRTSLKELGKSIGFEKLDMPDETASKDEWNTYCKQDIKVMQKAIHSWLDFCDDNDLGVFKTTLPSQAMTAYRHRFMDIPLFCDDNEQALSLCRESYYGGRTECFYIGKLTDEFYLLDVNSMYPYVMAAFDFPTSLYSVLGKTSISELIELSKKYFVIANITVNTKFPKIPLRKDGKLVFPIGKFSTTVTQPELSYEDIISVNKVVLYEKSKIFKRYCEYFYELKEKYRHTNESWFLLSKLMLNSLYGKFGQRGYNYENIGECDIDDFSVETVIDAETGEVFRERSFGGIRQRLKQDGESQNSIPAIAAAVTSYARSYLLKLIIQAGEHHVYYCDTDSLVVDSIGFQNLSDKIGDSLGKLKLEKEFRHLDIRALKDYTFDDKQRIKGVRKDAIVLSENSFQQQQFRSLKGALLDGDVDRMIISTVIKNLSRDYDKGGNKTGWIKPIVLK